MESVNLFWECVQKKCGENNATATAYEHAAMLVEVGMATAIAMRLLLNGNQK